MVMGLLGAIIQQQAYVGRCAGALPAKPMPLGQHDNRCFTAQQFAPSSTPTPATVQRTAEQAVCVLRQMSSAWQRQQQQGKPLPNESTPEEHGRVTRLATCAFKPLKQTELAGWDALEHVSWVLHSLAMLSVWDMQLSTLADAAVLALLPCLQPLHPLPSVHPLKSQLSSSTFARSHSTNTVTSRSSKGPGKSGTAARKSDAAHTPHSIPVAATLHPGHDPTAHVRSLARILAAWAKLGATPEPFLLHGLLQASAGALQHASLIVSATGVHAHAPAPAQPLKSAGTRTQLGTHSPQPSPQLRNLLQHRKQHATTHSKQDTVYSGAVPAHPVVVSGERAASQTQQAAAQAREYSATVAEDPPAKMRVREVRLEECGRALVELVEGLAYLLPPGSLAQHGSVQLNMLMKHTTSDPALSTAVPSTAWPGHLQLHPLPTAHSLASHPLPTCHPLPIRVRPHQPSNLAVNAAALFLPQRQISATAPRSCLAGATWAHSAPTQRLMGMVTSLSEGASPSSLSTPHPASLSAPLVLMQLETTHAEKLPGRFPLAPLDFPQTGHDRHGTSNRPAEMVHGPAQDQPTNLQLQQGMGGVTAAASESLAPGRDLAAWSVAFQDCSQLHMRGLKTAGLARLLQACARLQLCGSDDWMRGAWGQVLATASSAALVTSDVGPNCSAEPVQIRKGGRPPNAWQQQRLELLVGVRPLMTPSQSARLSLAGQLEALAWLSASRPSAHGTASWLHGVGTDQDTLGVRPQLQQILHMVLTSEDLQWWGPQRLAPLFWATAMLSSPSLLTSYYSPTPLSSHRNQDTAVHADQSMVTSPPFLSKPATGCSFTSGDHPMGRQPASQQSTCSTRSTSSPAVGLDALVVHAALEQLHGHLVMLSPALLAQALHAAAVLGVRPYSAWIAAFELQILLHQAAFDKRSSLMLVWSMARLHGPGLTPGSPINTALVAILARNVPEMSLGELRAMQAALGKLYRRKTGRPLQKLLHSMQARCSAAKAAGIQ